MNTIIKYSLYSCLLLFTSQSFSFSQTEIDLLVKQANHGDQRSQKKLISLYQKAAEQGDKNAQLYLGLSYKASMNYETAINWLEKSANQGCRDAQYHLGRMYYYGKGAIKDLDKAQKLLQSSCKNGKAEACYAIK